MCVFEVGFLDIYIDVIIYLSVVVIGVNVFEEIFFCIRIK